MSDLIISFIATVVIFLVIGGGILLVSWLAGIFGEAVIAPVILFIFVWICAYSVIQ